MLSFDSPEFKELTEKDDQVLANCKIDWESKLLPIAKEIMECREFLSERDIIPIPQPNCDNNIDEYSAEEMECIRRIEEKKEEKELRLVLNERYTQKLRIAEERLEILINNIQNIERNIAIETLANDMKNWKEYEMTKEEKEYNDKIIRDNFILAKAEFLSRIPNRDGTIKSDIKEAEGLEYKETFPDQYPWKDVALSLLKYPEKVVFDYDRCPDCGHSRIGVYFYSPECTWAMMCGVGGNMVICPECKIQAEFNETIRN